MPCKAPYLRTLKNVRNVDFEDLLCSVIPFLYLILSESDSSPCPALESELRQRTSIDDVSTFSPSTSSTSKIVGNLSLE